MADDDPVKRPNQCEIDPTESVMVLHYRGNADPPHPVGARKHAEGDLKNQMVIVVGQDRFPLRFFDDRFPENTGFSRLQTERRNERITDFHQPVHPARSIGKNGFQQLPGTQLPIGAHVETGKDRIIGPDRIGGIRIGRHDEKIKNAV